MTTYVGSCHCGRVRFEVVAEIDHVRSCDCSVCSKRGALNFRVPQRSLRLLSSWENLSLYQGGLPYRQGLLLQHLRNSAVSASSDPAPRELEEGLQPFDGWAVNVRCLEGVDLERLPVKRIYGSLI